MEDVLKIHINPDILMGIIIGVSITTLFFLIIIRRLIFRRRFNSLPYKESYGYGQYPSVGRHHRDYRYLNKYDHRRSRRGGNVMLFFAICTILVFIASNFKEANKDNVFNRLKGVSEKEDRIANDRESAYDNKSRIDNQTYEIFIRPEKTNEALDYTDALN